MNAQVTGLLVTARRRLWSSEGERLSRLYAMSFQPVPDLIREPESLVEKGERFVKRYPTSSAG